MTLSRDALAHLVTRVAADRRVRGVKLVAHTLFRRSDRRAGRSGWRPEDSRPGLRNRSIPRPDRRSDHYTQYGYVVADDVVPCPPAREPVGWPEVSGMATLNRPRRSPSGENISLAASISAQALAAWFRNVVPASVSGGDACRSRKKLHAKLRFEPGAMSTDQ